MCVCAACLWNLEAIEACEVHGTTWYDAATECSCVCGARRQQRGRGERGGRAESKGAAIEMQDSARTRKGQASRLGKRLGPRDLG